MKCRIATWASVGFLVACCWVLYTFVTAPDYLYRTLEEPATEAVLFASCPIAFVGRYFPLSFWWVPLMNAATYAVIGLMWETLRRKLNPRAVQQLV
jgi:hypothetical protein